MRSGLGVTIHVLLPALGVTLALVSSSPVPIALAASLVWLWASPPLPLRWLWLPLQLRPVTSGNLRSHAFPFGILSSCYTPRYIFPSLTLPVSLDPQSPHPPRWCRSFVAHGYSLSLGPGCLATLSCQLHPWQPSSGDGGVHWFTGNSVLLPLPALHFTRNVLSLSL